MKSGERPGEDKYDLDFCSPYIDTRMSHGVRRRSQTTYAKIPHSVPPPPIRSRHARRPPPPYAVVTLGDLKRYPQNLDFP